MYRLEEMDLHEEVSNRNNLPEEDISITGVNSALSTKDRSYFIDLCERCDNAEDARKILSLFDTISDDDVDLLAPTLPILAARQWPILNDRIKEVVMKFINFTSSRLVRKAAIAALRCLVPVDSSKSWSEFFVLINALDEPQFHLVEPALTKFDLLLNDCLESATEDGVTVRWIQVLFMKAIIHSNGWIIVTHLLPALNGNDVLWRLIDSGQLEKFIVDLGTFLEEVASNIVIYKRSQELPLNFVESVREHIGARIFAMEGTGEGTKNMVGEGRDRTDLVMKGDEKNGMKAVDAKLKECTAKEYVANEVNKNCA
ncbi:unnamed protein product [Anisakis simplex]|uniref:DUF577 domain-containing protein n=1 Tax=Anisakis simplex TaxID=6269 RepID=A0A0M3IY80_ANISI|nr:unnamed protein product [Anisakis simplex]